VNCGFAIPFILAFIHRVIKMMTMTDGISFRSLATLWLITTLLFLTDWIGCFLAATSVVLFLFHIRKNRKLLYPMLVIISGIISGSAIFLWQVISLLGSNTVVRNLSKKFLLRRTRFSDSILSITKEISIHFLTAFLPLITLLILLLLIVYLRRKTIFINIPSRLFYQLLIPALLLYNFVFLSWTRIHEFSILYFGPLFAIATGTSLPGLLKRKAIGLTLVLFTFLCIAEFYLINPPGPKGQNGVAYDVYKKLGVEISERTTKEQVIFSNVRLLPPVTYYAKRLITYSGSPEEARKQLFRFKSVQAVWIDVKNLEIMSITNLSK
jgi:hypothetical protein